MVLVTGNARAAQGFLSLYQHPRQEQAPDSHLSDYRISATGDRARAGAAGAVRPDGAIRTATVCYQSKELYLIRCFYVLSWLTWQQGDYRACRGHLEACQRWHLQKGIYLVLRDKLETICWRTLARRT